MSITNIKNISYKCLAEMIKDLTAEVGRASGTKRANLTMQLNELTNEVSRRTELQSLVLDMIG